MDVCSEQSNKPSSQMIHQYEVRQLNNWWVAGRSNDSGMKYLRSEHIVSLVSHTDIGHLLKILHAIYTPFYHLHSNKSHGQDGLCFSNCQFYIKKKWGNISRKIWSINWIINCFLPSCQHMSIVHLIKYNIKILFLTNISALNLTYLNSTDFPQLGQTGSLGDRLFQSWCQADTVSKILSKYINSSVLNQKLSQISYSLWQIRRSKTF